MGEDREAIVRVYRRAIERASATHSLLYLWGIREEMLRHHISFEELHTTEAAFDAVVRACDVAYCLRRLRDVCGNPSWAGICLVEDLIATGRVTWDELERASRSDDRPVTRAEYQELKRACEKRTFGPSGRPAVASASPSATLSSGA